MLYKELEILNIEFIDLYTQHKQMIESDSVILTSLYLEKLGYLQLELLKKQTESSRLIMKIKLIQAAYNRSEFPDLIAIEKILNDRLENYYSQIQSQSAMLDESKKILSSLLSEEETLKLKEIFRVLCKKLHPDLHPLQSEDEKDLFIKVKAAYDLQRISDLQSILLYLDNFDNEKLIELSIDEKANRIEFLKKNIDSLNGKIEQLKNSFPFNVEELIYNEEQISFKQEELKNQIKTFDEEIEKSTNTLKQMIDE